MKSKFSTIAILIWASVSHAQFTTGSGGFHIKQGATVFINRLLLQPTADINIANNTLLVDNVPVQINAVNSIARVYQWSSAINTQGVAGIYVAVPTELNGNNFNQLQMAYNPTGNTGGYVVPGNSSTNNVTNLVWENTANLTTWMHLTAVEIGAPLPLHLVAFTGKKEGTAAHLLWDVVNEEQMKSYVVQRSTDGLNYKSIGEVKAICNGCGNTTQYTFDDIKPELGYNYYRLQMVENDGNADYSQTIKLHFETTNMAIVLSPNPTDGKAVLSGLVNGKTYQLRVFTADGRQVKNNNLNVQNGVYEIETATWQSGTYFIHLQSENGSIYQQKLVRQ